MHKHNYLAVDLGATSGRTILGTIADGRVLQEQRSRFPNIVIHENGHFFWNIDALEAELIDSLRRLAADGVAVDAIGIDTWGVDFVVVGADGRKIARPWAYRDPCTVEAMREYFEKQLPRDVVYQKTGIQFLPFNTLFQLYALQKERPVGQGETVLFIPDYLSYRLTGLKVCERTIASTSQLLNARTGEFDSELLASVGLTRSHFGQMVEPGTLIGTLTEEMQRLTGLGPVPVVAVAGHDTASAVAAVPAEGPDFAYLSSGTWSLLGIEKADALITPESYKENFTNEGGVCGTTRVLKNICGMWLYERCRQEWQDKADTSHEYLLSEAMQCPSLSIINPDDPRFANPASMTQAISSYCRDTAQPEPTTPAETCRVIFDSLAHRYKEVFCTLQRLAQQPVSVLHIIGGGSRNDHLNQLTADALGLTVKAGPQECTAIGNIMMQAKVMGLVGDLWQMRRMIADSVETKTYTPQTVK